MSNKRYRLLKDLPDVKAGAVLEQEKLNGLYMYCGLFDGGDKDSWYIPETVENNPEWFIEEHQCKHCGAWTSQPDEECYRYPQPKEDKPEWEIIRILTAFGSMQAFTMGEIREGDKIYSVKRKDGIVFSVGDEVERVVGDNKIVSFTKLDNGEMIVHFSLGGFSNINFVKKSKPKEELKEQFPYFKSAIQGYDKYGSTEEQNPAANVYKKVAEYHHRPEELKEPERTKIVYGVSEAHYDRNAYEFWTDKPIDLSKHKYAIKQAIEQVLNDTDEEKEKRHKWHLKWMNDPPRYTQEQVNKMTEDAFNAARMKDVNSLSHFDQRPYDKYPTFQDYLSSLK